MNPFHACIKASESIVLKVTIKNLHKENRWLNWQLLYNYKSVINMQFFRKEKFEHSPLGLWDFKNVDCHFRYFTFIMQALKNNKFNI